MNPTAGSPTADERVSGFFDKAVAKLTNTDVDIVNHQVHSERFIACSTGIADKATSTVNTVCPAPYGSIDLFIGHFFSGTMRVTGRFPVFHARLSLSSSVELECFSSEWDISQSPHPQE